MNWIVNISKKSVVLENDIGTKKCAISIKDGWSAAIDKMDSTILVKLVNSKNDFIHLFMLPGMSTSIIWYDISEIYDNK